MKEYQVEWIVDTLCTNMTSDKEQLRDISSIGKFKHVISFIDDDSFCLKCFESSVLTIHFVDYAMM